MAKRRQAAQVRQDQFFEGAEGALWGSIHAHGFLQDAVLLSDDAGQFDVGRHALCWAELAKILCGWSAAGS